MVGITPNGPLDMPWLRAREAGLLCWAGVVNSQPSSRRHAQASTVNPAAATTSARTAVAASPAAAASIAFCAATGGSSGHQSMIGWVETLVASPNVEIELSMVR